MKTGAKIVLAGVLGAGAFFLVRALTGAAPGNGGGRAIYASDDWISAPSGAYRWPTLNVGWTGGLLMEQQTGWIKFNLPAGVSSAILILTPVEYFNANWPVSIKIGGLEVGIDARTDLTPFGVNLGSLLPGELLVELDPVRPVPDANFHRKYASVRGPAASAPRLVVS